MSIRALEPITGPIEHVGAGHVGTVGSVQGSALYIASVLGTGILVLPALASAAAGPASILAVLAVLGLSIPLAGTFAALAARHPDAGGVATYVRLALGKTAARVTGYWFFFGVSIGAPVVAVLGASYMGSILGASREVIIMLAAVILIPPFIANMFGLRFSGGVQVALTGLLMAVVVSVVVVAAPAGSAENFTPFMPHGWAGVGLAVSLFVWAFAGWEAVTHLAGEFTNPRRTIPLATAIAIVVVGVAYLALQLVTVWVLGPTAGDGHVPLLDLVTAAAPGAGPTIVAVAAGVVSMGVLNTYLGAFAKLGASLGRDGDLPRWMAAGAHPGGIARRGLAVTGVIIAIYFVGLILAGLDLTLFVLIHTSCMVAIYALGMVAALRLLERWSLGWWMALVSCVLVAGLLALAGAQLLVPAGLAAAALIVTLVKYFRLRALLRLTLQSP